MMTRDFTQGRARSRSSQSNWSAGLVPCDEGVNPQRPLQAKPRAPWQWLVFVALFAATDAHAFRPLCNSLGSGGGQFDDGCGACSTDTASRWEPSAITLRFDRSSVPSARGVSASRFASDIDNIIAAWNGVPGSALVITDGGDASAHDFGDNSASQEVWWAVTDDEWINTTGTAPNGGALGITEPRYSCDLNGDGRREPWFDADIILNGTPGGGFTWNCEGLDCPSSTSVLLHEAGHALGLGHPCSECEDAVMGATLIVNPIVPLPDDALSLSSLYPVDGALGTSCTAPSDCDSGDCGVFEMPSGSLQYCTQTCGACPSGFTCAAGQCEMASAAFASLPDVGEACAFTCVDDCFAFGGPDALVPGCNACLVGAGADGESAACVRACSRATGDGCDLANEFCSGVGAGDDQGACKPRRAEGGACANDSFCLEELSCVGNVCRPGCASSAECSPGQDCVDGTCRGGLEGETCAAASDCAAGLLCTGFNGAFFCYATCDAAAQTGCDDANGEVCAQAGADVEICLRIRNLGDSCAEFNAFCADGECIDALCTRNCDLASGDGCEAGEACVDVNGNGNGRCIPDGGAQVGDACSANADCVAGALCVGSVCTQRCDLDVPCAFDEVCTPVAGGAVCEPIGEGEGEGEGEGNEGEGEANEGEGEDGEGEGEGEEPEGCTCASSSRSSSSHVLFVVSLLALFVRKRRSS